MREEPAAGGEPATAATPAPGFAPYMDPSADPRSYVDRYNSDSGYREWFDASFAGTSIYEAVGLPEPAPFVEPGVDPWSYVNRYNSDSGYREWFDASYPEYSSIYAAAGLPEPKPTAPFVDPDVDPRYYVARYGSEPAYREWFGENFPGYTIYEAVGLPESDDLGYGECGIGTSLIAGECVPVRPPPRPLGEKTPAGGGAAGQASPTPPSPSPSGGGGGCLVATAAYGTELAPQVQLLREVRDTALLQTPHGASFMAAFNAAYYSFSPAVADMERALPALRGAIAALLSPMLWSLSLMSAADPASPGSVVAAGAAVIALNAAAYAAAPAAAAAWAAGRMRRQAKASPPRRPAN